MKHRNEVIAKGGDTMGELWDSAVDNLNANFGPFHPTMRHAVCLDYQVEMHEMYRPHDEVQKMLDRALAMACATPGTAPEHDEVEVFFMGNRSWHAGAYSLENRDTFLTSAQHGKGFGTTDAAGAVSGVTEVMCGDHDWPKSIPVLAWTFSTTGPEETKPANYALREASEKPIYWAPVHLGRERDGHTWWYAITREPRKNARMHSVAPLLLEEEKALHEDPWSQ